MATTRTSRECGIYAQVIVDEARRRGIDVTVVDATRGELRLALGDRRIDTIESLSELTSAVAFRRCDHKPSTRRVLQRAGLAVPAGRIATFDAVDERFLEEFGDVVVKPARGEQGWGITVGVTDAEALAVAVAAARAVDDEVLIEERVRGTEMRIVVIGGEVVAAAERRPPAIQGNGDDTVGQLIRGLSDARSAATAGASIVPLDSITAATVTAAGYTLDSVLADGERLVVRNAANLHAGGTLHDVTATLSPSFASAATRAADAIGIPVVGFDVIGATNGRDCVFIEANEQPGLAHHEPRPTVERFVDLMFPESARSGSV